MRRHTPPRRNRRVADLPVRFSTAALMALAVLAPVRAAYSEDSGACDTTRVVAAALPATVNVTVVKVVKGDAADGTQSSPEQVELAYGSGVIVDPSGLIITNKHVIKDAAHIWVTFSDRDEVDAQLVGAASLLDLAILKVDVPRPLPALKFANSDAQKIGEPVIAVGNPLGLGTSVSTGIVSAVNRDLMRTPWDDFIQTDASINPGNSGGALLNCAGDIIGINTALVSNNALLGSIGLGFALPANDIDFVFHRMLDSRTASPTWVGLHLQDLTARLAFSLGRPNIFGAIVTSVDPGSPAARAGIEAGDVITTVDGEPMSDARAVQRSIITRRQGQRIAFSVCNGSDVRDVTLTGEAWPHMMELRSDVLASAASVARVQSQGIGLHLAPLTAADRKRLGVPDGEGVLIDRVTPGSQAATLGLHAGEAIEEMNHRPVTSPDQIPVVYGHGDPRTGDMIAVLVRGKEKTRWVSLFVGHVDVAELLAPPPPTIEAKAITIGNAVAGGR